MHTEPALHYEGQAAPREAMLENSDRPVDRRTIGHIIHAAYGISMDGAPQEPATYDQLEAMGYSFKEIHFALMAGLLTETMAGMADVVAGKQFVPLSDVAWEGSTGTRYFSFESAEDLSDPAGGVDYVKTKLYLNALVGNAAQQTLQGSFRSQHPGAYDILKHTTGFKADDTETLAALDIGLSAVLGTEHFIDDEAGAAIGPSMQASAPVLYKLAGKNMDTMGDPSLLESAFTGALDPHTEALLRHNLRSELLRCNASALARLKDSMMNSLLEDNSYDNDDPNRFAALVDMDAAFASVQALVGYITSTQHEAYPGSGAASEAHQFYRELADHYVITRLSRWLEAAQIVPWPELRQSMSDFELATTLTPQLRDEFFTKEREPDGTVRVKLREADTMEPGRAREALFRQEIWDEKQSTEGNPAYISADLARTNERTVRCSALLAVMPSDKRTALRDACDRLGFNPKQMNGIDFVVLLSLWATEAVRTSAVSAS